MLQQGAVINSTLSFKKLRFTEVRQLNQDCWRQYSNLAVLFLPLQPSHLWGRACPAPLDCGAMGAMGEICHSVLGITFTETLVGVTLHQK